MNPIFVKAAYGRTYPNEEEAKQDWEAGLDFKIVYGPYCSVRDFDKHLDTVICIVENDIFILNEGLGL